MRRRATFGRQPGAGSRKLCASLRAVLPLTRVLRNCASQRHAITGHASVSQALALQAQGGGRLTDGMGSGGHSASITGQDYAVVQAAAVGLRPLRAAVKPPTAPRGVSPVASEQVSVTVVPSS
eukprot:COSAG02_NODE_33791_length_494_cov_1.096203_1_plen_122_part_10